MIRPGAALLLVPLLGWVACDNGAPPAPDYYDRVIQPIFNASCIRNQGGCHQDDGTGSALGNLALTSYADTTRRKDVVRTYGSYSEPLLLLKGAGPGVTIPYKPGRGDGKTAFLDSQIQHAGGAPISRNSQAFFVLQQWLAIGATSDGAAADRKLDANGHGDCTKDFAAARPDLAAKLNVATVMDSDPLYQQFRDSVEPVLAKNCAFGSCHSSPQSDFFLACDGDDGTKFNYLEAKEFVSAPPESSEFLLRPLAPASGGVSHTGGVFFATKTDSNYVALLDWAAKVPPAGLAMRSDGRKFFDDEVMPVLLQRGCALEACHSPGAANDFKLRPGSQGYFSASALERNYEEARRGFLDVDVPDVRVSRIVRKPVVRVSEGGIGIAHRGGPVLQSPNDPPGLDPVKCAPFNPKTSTPFCTFVEWHRIERQDLLSKSLIDPLSAHTELVYVDRAADSDGPTAIDTYHPDSDLILADVTLGALGRVDAITPKGSLLGTCPGSKGTRDVRHPDVDYDASRVVFAMRTSAGGAFDLYTVGLNGTGCQIVATGKSGAMQNGLPLSDLDPIFAPTQKSSSIVFASTRGKNGPSLSLKHLRVQTDLWRLPGDGTGGFGKPSQMTALLGSELGPAMMMNGEVSFTAEKASADFYQLSGRRINWDGTDYHPLLAQRKSSRGFDPTTLAQPAPLDQIPTHPSVGFQRATEIREGIDRNFVFIASDESSVGAGGALCTFNRSVGPFEADRTNVGFLPALEVLDGAGPGGYRSPVQLPDGRYLVAYSFDVAGGAYDMAIVDPSLPAGARRTIMLSCGPGRACVQPAFAYQRERRPLFNNVAQLVFGGRADPADPGHGVVSYPDLPMLATLLGANLRTGRFVDPLRAAAQVAIYEDHAPSDLVSGMAGLGGSERVYQSRVSYGAVKLNNDGSVKLRLPSLTPIILELQDKDGKPIFTMAEEDQLGPGEIISRGVPQGFFDSVCAGCHGSVSGRELDVAVNPDALTGASRSLAHDAAPAPLGP